MWILLMKQPINLGCSLIKLHFCLSRRSQLKKNVPSNICFGYINWIWRGMHLLVFKAIIGWIYIGYFFSSLIINYSWQGSQCMLWMVPHEEIWKCFKFLEYAAWSRWCYMCFLYLVSCFPHCTMCKLSR